MRTGSSGGDAFGRSRDGAARRRPGEPEDIDTVIVDAFRLVRAHDDTPGPSAVFLGRLEADLTDQAGRTRPVATGPLVGGAGRQGRTPSWLGRWFADPRSGSSASLATAALIVLTLATTFVAFRPGREGPDKEPRPLAVGQAGTPTADGCGVAPRREVPAPPRSGSAENVLPFSVDGRPAALDAAGVAALSNDARPADLAGVDGVAATLRALAACEAEPGGIDPARLAAFYTDHYLFFALDMPGMTPPQTIAGERLRERLDALQVVSFGRGESTVEASWQLATGEIGTVVRPPQGPAYVVVFARTGDRWLIDELAEFAVPAGTTPAAGTPTAEATPSDLAAVAKFDMIYVPATLTIPAETPVTLALTNAGQAPHAFVVDPLGIDVQLRPGETTTITIEAPIEVYEFYSDIPGQREGGMVGTLTVFERTTPVPGASTPAQSGFAPTHQVNDGGSVNLRAEPSWQSPILAVLPPATSLHHVGEEAPTADPATDGRAWLKFLTEDGQRGWIREIDVEAYRVAGGVPRPVAEECRGTGADADGTRRCGRRNDVLVAEFTRRNGLGRASPSGDARSPCAVSLPPGSMGCG